MTKGMNSSKKSILLVDDSLDILEAVKLILEDGGYDVWARDKGEYLEDLHKQVRLPDLIILDMLLSGKDGRELATALKNNSRTRPIPIIMLSAHPSLASIKGSGADAFLPKPFEIDELLGLVKK